MRTTIDNELLTIIPEDSLSQYEYTTTTSWLVLDAEEVLASWASVFVCCLVT